MGISVNVNAEEFAKSAEDRGPRTGFDPLPNGSYEAELLKAEVKPFAKSGANASLPAYHLVWKVTDSHPEYKNRRLWDTVALADKFASGKPNFKFAALMSALGIKPDEDGNIEVPDADELTDLAPTLGLEVSVDGERNNVVRYLNGEQLAKRIASEEKTEKVEDPALSSGSGMFL